MIINKISFILLSLIITTSAAQHRHGRQTNPTLERVCKRTEYPELCVASISPLITPGAPLDVISMLKLEIKASLVANKAAQAKLDATPVKKGDPAASALRVCKELYNDAVDCYHTAANAIPKRDMMTINVELSAAMTNYDTCNDSCREAGIVSPVADVSKKLTMLSSNCLALASFIK